MARFHLDQGEKELGHKTLFFLPATGGKYSGKLLVTDRRIVFVPAKAGFFPRQDFSAKGVVGALTVGSAFLPKQLRNYWDGEILSIPRADVRSVEKRSAHHLKQVAVLLADGQEFVFDNGIMSVDKLAALIQG